MRDGKCADLTPAVPAAPVAAACQGPAAQTAGNKRSGKGHVGGRPGVTRSINKARENIKASNEWYQTKFQAVTRTSLPVVKAGPSR